MACHFLFSGVLAMTVNGGIIARYEAIYGYLFVNIVYEKGLRVYHDE